MTVASETFRATYTGGSGVVTFAYAFKIFAKTDLVVKVEGAIKTVDVDYTVTGVGETGGGNVVFGTAPTTGQLVEIERDLALTQSQTYPEGGAFPASSHEAALDRLTFIAQQLEWAKKVSAVTHDPDTSGWGTTQEGWMWYNLTTHLFKYWNGSAIKTVTSS